jgi:hypothetical protein
VQASSSLTSIEFTRSSKVRGPIAPPIKVGHETQYLDTFYKPMGKELATYTGVKLEFQSKPSRGNIKPSSICTGTNLDRRQHYTII